MIYKVVSTFSIATRAYNIAIKWYQSDPEKISSNIENEVKKTNLQKTQVIEKKVEIHVIESKVRT